MLTALGLFVGAAFGYCFYNARLQVEENKLEILDMRNEMNDIKHGSKEFLIQSMRDKKEGTFSIKISNLTSNRNQVFQKSVLGQVGEKRPGP